MKKSCVAAYPVEWPDGRGISGRMRVEWVAGSAWNRWSDAHGMGGQMTVESATKRKYEHKGKCYEEEACTGRPRIDRPFREAARGDLLDPGCPTRDVLKHVTSRWGVLVLIALEGETYRFSDLRRKVGGVSERMLAQTLQWLETDGFVSRRAYPVMPTHVEYRLTPLGDEVAERVRLLADWIETNFPRIAKHWEAASKKRTT